MAPSSHTIASSAMWGGFFSEPLRCNDHPMLCASGYLLSVLGDTAAYTLIAPSACRKQGLTCMKHADVDPSLSTRGGVEGTPSGCKMRRRRLSWLALSCRRPCTRNSRSPVIGTVVPSVLCCSCSEALLGAASSPPSTPSAMQLKMALPSETVRCLRPADCS